MSVLQLSVLKPDIKKELIALCGAADASWKPRARVAARNNEFMIAAVATEKLA